MRAIRHAYVLTGVRPRSVAGSHPTTALSFVRALPGLHRRYMPIIAQNDVALMHDVRARYLRASRANENSFRPVTKERAELFDSHRRRCYFTGVVFFFTISSIKSERPRISRRA